MSDERVWLRHPETGGMNAFSAEAAAVWQARGWVPCEEPAEDLSYLRDPQPEPPAIEAIPEPAPESEPASARRRQNVKE
jgi:hypothetical protein